ncbi:hypothetical protein TKK_0001374 [Trichogramma kaykai]|uniref:Mediator of RNA polymerase II transcription subunit 6 n=1 Tax=Trichogramma kaykai TaxID=54128 RepID=A0ABD2WRG7_9HYME
MIPGRSMPAPENPLGLSWHDSAWIPMLNPGNIMDYFSERTNPFYDRTCNNETIKMQRLTNEHLQNLTGIEYTLLHVQEPILYVIRKQHRHSPTQVTPINDYYIIAGVVYQAPDLGSVINSRLLTTVNHLQSAFEEASSFSRYNPNKGYFWDFGNKGSTTKNDSVVKEEPSTLFQRQRVDMLLGDLTRKFPPPAPKQIPVAAQPTPIATAVPAATEPNAQIKTEPQTDKKDMKPPPEKKMKLK